MFMFKSANSASAGVSSMSMSRENMKDLGVLLAYFGVLRATYFFVKPSE